MSLVQTEQGSSHPATSPTGTTAVPRGRRTWLVRSVVVIVLLLGFGMAAQLFLDWRDGRQHPAPGELVELADGRLIHVQLSGIGHPGPVVILEAGAGSFSSQWSRVQEQISEFAPVLSYDRAGFGWSDAPNGERSADAVVEDLDEVLTTLELEGPYVLVGHSFGAVFSRMFAQANPDDVVGLVLVDPAHEEQFERFPAMGDMTVARLMPSLARVGLLRLLKPFDVVGDGMDPDAFAAWKSVAYTTRYADAQLEEAYYLVDIVGPVFAARDRNMGMTPLVVLQAEDAVWADDGMPALQRELLDLSQDSRLEVVTDADHFSIVTQADNARRVAESVQYLVEGTDSDSRPTSGGASS